MKTRFIQAENGKYWLEEQELPPLGDKEALIKTTKSLISVGTEMVYNTMPDVKKFSQGYSNIGKIVAINHPWNGFKVGMRVASEMPHTDYYKAAACDDLYAIPDGVQDEEASFFNLARVGLRAVERANLAIGQPVVVVGQGTVGQLTAQIARIAGAGRIIAVDLEQRRLELSKKMGADFAILPSQENFIQAMASLPADSPAPVFIEATGSISALKWIISVAPIRSRIVLTGTFCEPITFNPFVFIEKELDMIGAHQPKTPQRPNPCYPYCRTYNINLVFDWMRQGVLKTKGLWDATLSPEQVIDFYDSVRDGKPHPYQPIIDWEKSRL